MKSIILYCPHLDRDLRPVFKQVPNTLILTGYPTPQGHDGCLEMHKQAIRIAKHHGWDRVFVMEDDCDFTPAFSWDAWQQDATRAREIGGDMLVGGCVGTYGARRLTDRLVAVDRFHSAHCVVYFSSGYDRALNAVQPYDISLGEVGVRPIVTVPFVAVQKPSFSGILLQDVNYVPLYHMHEQYLLSLQ